jgi:hypothetical protein
MQVREAWCYFWKKLKGAKDSRLSFGVQKFINYKPSKVGEVLKLKLNANQNHTNRNHDRWRK